MHRQNDAVIELKVLFLPNALNAVDKLTGYPFLFQGRTDLNIKCNGQTAITGY